MNSHIKNLSEAAERIKKAVEDGERIILYGDSDLDGISSVVILEEAIKSLGGKVKMAVFPDRENDGYGINLKALEFLKAKAPALFITLDLGISNNKEIEIANGMGFEVLVVDHHQPPDILPNAKIIVDPKQAGDNYPFKEMCNAGLTFKLALEIIGKDISKSQENSFLELAALATISDMMAQNGDNKEIIEKGLRSLKNTFRPGLKIFLDILGQGEAAAGNYAKIISALNASESVDFKNDSYLLLTSHSEKEGRELAENLLGKVNLKQQRIKSITQEVEKRISEKPEEIIIFEGDPAWKLTLAGPVASIIAQKYEKPAFIYKKMDTESCGSVRSLKDGQNSVSAMKSCEDLLITYGGHPKASGFRIKNKSLEEFKYCLSKHFEKLKK
ncbi:MAG: DHH family phosphoesterase [Patescibacteria group bacterium]